MQLVLIGLHITLFVVGVFMWALRIRPSAMMLEVLAAGHE